MNVIEKPKQTDIIFHKNNVFLFCIVISTISVSGLYFFWYWISPVSDAFEIGRFLYIIYLLAVLFWLVIRGKLSVLASLFMLFFLVISILYYKNFVSRILDKVEYDGVRYYLTYSQEPFDGWHDYHITAREGLFHYYSHGLGLVLAADKLELRYDSTISKMTVIETQGRYSREIIFSIEEESPLFYETFEELDNNLYYLFSSCRKIGVDCQNRNYFLYKCKLDNTYCHQVYYYGSEPKCYEEDCYIPTIP